MRKRHVVLSAIVIAVAGTAVALTVPAIAGTSTPPGAAGTFSDASEGIDPDVVTAMQRDFSLSVEEVSTRIHQETWAAETETTLRAQLGSRFAGAWLTDGAEQLVVAVTTESDAEKVEAAGAEAKIVTTSESELDTLKDTIDEHAEDATQSVAGWYVDVTTSSVVVVAKPGGEADAQALIDASNVTASAGADTVRIVTSDESPTPLYDVRGADAYYINSTARCSIGFAVVGGFVSAGHCGSVGDTTAGTNKISQGTFKVSSFPSNDYSFISVNSNWTPTAVVNDFSGGTVAVNGSEEAAVGSAVCRSGSTTGTHCGTIQAKNATVNYAEGTVNGLTRTDVCAEPGDSGGSWMSGNQAQGVTSGGSGDCTSGGVTFFQPINEILTANSLTLATTSSSGGSDTGASASPSISITPSSAAPTTSSAKPSATTTTTKPPASSTATSSPTATATATSSPTRTTTPSATTSPTATATATATATPTPTASSTTPPSTCDNLEASADGELTETGQRKTIPSAGYFRASSGEHVACLTGPTSANFDLYLQKWNGRKWTTVASSDTHGIGEDEQLTYNGSAGYYRYRIISGEGSGPYLLTAAIP